MQKLPEQTTDWKRCMKGSCQRHQLCMYTPCLAPQTTLRAFNTNGYVRVKFSPATLKLWRAEAARMRAIFPNHDSSWPLEPPLDSEGFYRDQFWSIMRLVAPELEAGGCAFEDGCVHLEFEG